MTEQRCRLHGLDVRSSIPLHQHRRAVSTRDDVVLDWGAPAPSTHAVPTGRLVAEAVTEEGRFYTMVDTGRGYLLRYHGICDFLIDAAVKRATCHLATGADPGLVSVLASGGLLAAMLMLRGDLVLHASAVMAGAGAVAFVGDSGMGKSTLATLLAQSGAPLVADDVLRVRLGRVSSVYAGASETRLRPGATGLLVDRTPSRETADGRTAVMPVASDEDLAPLAGIVVPFPSRQAQAVKAVRLGPRDALLLLVRFPRILGWKDSATLRLQFNQLADLVATVPVFTANVPWGPPFEDQVAVDLLALAHDPIRPSIPGLPGP